MFQKIKSFLFENTTAKQTVAKNTFWLTVSNFGGRLIKAIVILYAARVLGTEGYGVFSYAITLAGTLTIFMDPGINGILMRDASRANDEERRIIFDTTLVIKLCLLLIGIAIIIFVAPLFTTLAGAKALLPVIALVLALDTLRDFFSSLLRAMEKMEWEAVIYIVTNIGIVFFSFIFLLKMPTARSFSLGYAIGDICGLLAAIVILRRYFKKIFFYFSPARIMPIFKTAWPFALSGALGLLFTNIDILMISWMKSASSVGIYSAAIRIIQVLYIIPSIIQLTTLPLFARLAKKDNPKFRIALEQTLVMVFLASVPLSLGGVILGTPIMGFLFGTPYRAGGLALEILMATLMFDFAATVMINALFAFDHQKSLVISSALGGSLNVVLDLLLIPPFGMAGSAVATLIAQATNNGYLWHAMKKINYFKVLPQLKKIIIAGIAMAAATLFFSSIGIGIIINIIASSVIYFFFLYLLREPLLIEIKKLLAPVATTA